jgi:parallel beta-helix repeat protein
LSRKTVSVIMMSLLVLGTLALTFNVQPVKSDYTWTGVIQIQADGNVQPPTAPISSVDNVTYKLTDNIVADFIPVEECAIIVRRDNTILDGAGYTLQGGGINGGENSQGIDLYASSNVTIQNMEISGFFLGIWFYLSSNNIVSGNNITTNGCGISLDFSSNNTICHNNFVNNVGQVGASGYPNVWDGGYPFGGNYWSDYSGVDLYSGPYQNQTGSDGIGDTPYVINANNRDNYPLMRPALSTNWNPSWDSYSQINFISAWAAGNCYGLSSTEILYFMHYVLGNTAYPYLPAQDTPATWTSDLYLPTNPAELNNASLAVMFHQVYDPNNSKFSSFIFQIERVLSSDFENAEYNKLVGTLWSGVPALLGMHGFLNGSNIGHAIVAYGIEMLPDGTVNIRVSDPNFPQQEEIANYNPSTRTFSYSAGGLYSAVGMSFDAFEVITPQAISTSWWTLWWYELTQSSWWYHNWLNFSVTGYNIVIADKNVTIKSSGLIDKFTQMGNSQTLFKAIPGSSGIEEGNVQVYAIPTGTPYAISDPGSNQSTILIARVDNESGQLVGYGNLLNASTTQGSLNFTATTSNVGLSISAGDNALNASVTCFSATQQCYSVSDVLTTQINAGQSVNLTAPCLASFTASKTVVGKGYSIPMNITINNVGPNLENVTLTLSANTTTLNNTKVFNLLNGTSVNLVCIGNTSSCTYGNYTLSAYCMPNGINEAANNFTYTGTVTVTIPGDINGDFKVSLSDLSLLAKAYNTAPGSPKWNANADINGDGKIGLPDLSILAKNYGQHNP